MVLTARLWLSNAQPYFGLLAQEISKDLEGKVTVLDRTRGTCGSDPSIEMIVEATTAHKSAVPSHFYGEHYDGPTSMERLQAYHDRMDMLMRVYTRLPEQILLDAARAGGRLVNARLQSCRSHHSRVSSRNAANARA